MVLTGISPKIVQEAIDEYDSLGVSAFRTRYHVISSKSITIDPTSRKSYDLSAITYAVHFRATGNQLPTAERSRAEKQLSEILKSQGFVTPAATARDTKKTERAFGEVHGYPEGSTFTNRQDAFDAGVHRALQAGIVGDRATGAESIVVSDGYEDDNDFGDLIIYTGHGGRDRKTQTQTADQSFAASGNAALVTSMYEGSSVRVVRGTPKKTTKKRSEYTPFSGYRYDGLYRVASSWLGTGKNGFRICQFRLEKESPEPLGVTIDPTLSSNRDAPPSGNQTPKIGMIKVQRKIRTSAVARFVKELYNHTCQICRTRLTIGEVGYSEGAHIKAIGTPHNGPDIPSNVLCLCANCHVLFDHGAITISDNFMVLDGRKEPSSLYYEPEHHIGRDFLAYHRALCSF